MGRGRLERRSTASARTLYSRLTASRREMTMTTKKAKKESRKRSFLPRRPTLSIALATSDRALVAERCQCNIEVFNGVDCWLAHVQSPHPGKLTMRSTVSLLVASPMQHRSAMKHTVPARPRKSE